MEGPSVSKGLKNWSVRSFMVIVLCHGKSFNYFCNQAKLGMNLHSFSHWLSEPGQVTYPPWALTYSHLKAGTLTPHTHTACDVFLCPSLVQVCWLALSQHFVTQKLQKCLCNLKCIFSADSQNKPVVTSGERGGGGQCSGRKLRGTNY